MDSSKVKRWSILGTALLATLAAIAYPVEDEVQLAPMPQPVAAQGAEQKAGQAEESGAIDWVASDVDPFAARGWQAPPPPPPPEQARVIQAVEAGPAAPPPPPALPYKFIGQMNDGTDRILYLGRGEQVQLARQGDVLDGTYKVLSVSATQIEFELISSGLKQWLAIPAQDK